MITNALRKLMEDKNTSIMYKFGFWILKYIQSIVFLFLLFISYSNLNHLANLMYMAFFVVYTAFIKFYRLTSKSIIILFSYLIMSQYFYSLYYHKMIMHNGEMDKGKMYNLAWSGFYRCPKFTVE